MASADSGASTQRIDGKCWRMNSPAMLPWVSARVFPGHDHPGSWGCPAARRVTSTEGLVRNGRVNSKFFFTPGTQADAGQHIDLAALDRRSASRPPSFMPRMSNCKPGAQADFRQHIDTDAAKLAFAVHKRYRRDIFVDRHPHARVAVEPDAARPRSIAVTGCPGWTPRLPPNGAVCSFVYWPLSPSGPC